MKKNSSLRFYFFTMLFFASAFLNAKEDVKKPLWITNTAMVCSPLEICAFSEASDLESAKKQALLNLANSIKTKITSTFNSQISLINDSIKETTFEEIFQSTDLELQGAEIKQTFESENKYYAFATLSKLKMAKNIELENNELNLEIKNIKNNPAVSNLLKLNQISNKKKEYETIYRLLINEELPKEKDLIELQKIKAKIFKKTNLFIFVDNDETKQIEKFLKSFYSKNKLKITSQSNFNYKIEGNLHVSPESLKVEGFEKYNFSLQISSQKFKQSNKSMIEIHFSETGRNFNQIKEKAILKIIEELKDKIYDLELN